MISLAMDKSVRSYDRDGRLHVAKSNISKAAVNEYFGSEIPRHQELGLDPNKMYKLLRCPEELKKAAHTFNNIPILERHIPDTAEKPARQHWVGTTGSDAEFEAPYLANSLAIWENGAIAGIETGELIQLSSAYHYELDLNPGVYEGQHFDFKMINIVGNHVAIVKEGRAGPDVLVGDSKPQLTTESKHMSYDTEAIKSALGEYGMDDESLESAVQAVLSVLPEIKAEDNEPEDEPASDETEEKAEDESEDDPTPTPVGDKNMGMDQARLLQKIRTQVQKDFKDLEIAKEAVRPLVGTVLGMDNAAAVYKFTLENVGVDIKGVHPSAYPSLVKMAVESKSESKTPVIALDAKSKSAFDKLFPNASIK